MRSGVCTLLVVAALGVGLVIGVAAAKATAVQRSNRYHYDWFAPGYYAVDSYDDPQSERGSQWCNAYYDNKMYTQHTSDIGEVAYIKTNGSWTYGKTGSGGLIESALPSDVYQTFRKKPICINTDNATYWANCYDYDWAQSPLPSGCPYPV